LKEQLVVFYLRCAPQAQFLETVGGLLEEPDEEVVLYTLDHLLSLPSLPNLPPPLQSRLWTLATTHPWPLLVSNSLRLLYAISLSSTLSATPENLTYLLSLLQNPPTEPIKEAALTLLGPLTTTTAALTALLPHLRLAAHEDSPYTLRHAALTSLSALTPLLALSQEKNDEALIPAYALLFDFLNDDDDDLRLTASQLCRSIHPTSNSNLLLPLVAAEKLALELPRYFPGSQVLLEEAVRRITGGIDAKDEWKRVSRKDTILFRREKQNLWVDLPWVVRVWGAVGEMIVARRGDLEGTSGLKEWVCEAKGYVEDMEKREGPRGKVNGWGSEEEIEVYCVRIEVGERVCGL
jgi:hypothetical protein